MTAPVLRARQPRALVVSFAPTTEPVSTLVLGMAEHERASRYRFPAEARRFAAARVLLRFEVARWMEIHPTDVAVTSTCRRCGGEHGQIRVDGPGKIRPPHVSITHSPQVVAVALSDAGPVGIDVEAWEAASFERFDEVAMHPLERATTAVERSRLWVRKESLLKATGHGLTVDPRDLRLSDGHAEPRLLEWNSPARRPGPTWMFDLEVSGSHVACATVVARRKPGLTVRTGDLAANPRSATRRTAVEGWSGSASRPTR